MEYVLTEMDMLTIWVIVCVALVLWAFWPRGDDKSGPDVKVHHFVMGANAMRIGWDKRTNAHEIAVQYRRSTEWQVAPKVGDIVHIVEHDKSSFRGRVIDIPHHVDLLGQPTQVTLIVHPLLRGE